MTEPEDVSYSRQGVRVLRTAVFDNWLQKLRDIDGRRRITRRLDRLSTGNPGDVRPIGGGLSELRINTGPGYRVYYLKDGNTFVLLLCGGDKSSQQRDIEMAHELATEWRSEKERRRQ